MTEWIDLYSESHWLQSDATGEDEARFIRQALALQPGMRVLDIPCGAGRVAVHLAEAGCRVTGIDRNPNFIARAGRRFASEGVDGTFRVLDMRALDDVAAFEAIYNWGGSFGYFSDEENADVLHRMAAALAPGGRLLIEQPNREYILRHFIATNQVGEWVSRTRWDTATQRIITEWTSDAGQPGFASSMRLYTLAQFRRLFADAGLKVKAIYGDRDGGFYTRRCRRMSVVGRER